MIATTAESANLFDGLRLYEALLLSLGATLFLVLMGLLVYVVTQNKDKKAVFGLFPLAFAIVAFPGYESIKIDGAMVELRKAADTLEANPEDAEAQETMAEVTETLASRKDEIADPERLKDIERAGAVEELVAIERKADKLDPNDDTEREQLADRFQRLKSQHQDVLSPAALTRVDKKAFRRVVRRPRPVAPMESPGDAAMRTYLGVIKAWNDNDAAAYSAGFSEPMECFYNRANGSLARTPRPGSRLTVHPQDIRVVAQAPDRVVMCEVGKYRNSADGLETDHNKGIVMGKTDDGWKVVVEVTERRHRCFEWPCGD